MANVGRDNRNIFKTWLSRTMQFNLHSKCVYDRFYEPTKTRSHPADLMERKIGEAVRGRGRKTEKGTCNDYLWPLDYVPVLGEPQAFVGVLISRVCNRRNPFCCRAQPSHLSAWIQPPLIPSVITSVCSLCLHSNCDNCLVQP